MACHTENFQLVESSFLHGAEAYLPVFDCPWGQPEISLQVCGMPLRPRNVAPYPPSLLLSKSHACPADPGPRHRCPPGSSPPPTGHYHSSRGPHGQVSIQLRVLGAKPWHPLSAPLTPWSTTPLGFLAGAAAKPSLSSFLQRCTDFYFVSSKSRTFKSIPMKLHRAGFRPTFQAGRIISDLAYIIRCISSDVRHQGRGGGASGSSLSRLLTLHPEH